MKKKQKASPIAQLTRRKRTTSRRVSFDRSTNHSHPHSNRSISRDHTMSHITSRGKVKISISTNMSKRTIIITRTRVLLMLVTVKKITMDTNRLATSTTTRHTRAHETTVTSRNTTGKRAITKTRDTTKQLSSSLRSSLAEK